MADQLDLYIEQKEKNEKTGNVEMELYAELTALNDAGADAAKQSAAGAQDLEQSLSAASTASGGTRKEIILPDGSAASESGGTGRAPGQGGNVFLTFQRSNTAHNWWLALIAALLFLNLIFNKN